MKDLNYVIGRLQGLNELVKILKDLVNSKETKDSEIIAVVTNHISEQLNSVLGEFDDLDVEPQHKEALAEIKDKHKEKPPPASMEEAKGEQAPSGKEQPESKGDEASPSGSKENLDKHEKTVDELLKDLENLKSG